MGLKSNQVLSAVLVTLIFVASGLAQNHQKRWPCKDTPRIAGRANGTPFWLTHKKLESMAINKVSPKQPSSCRCEVAVIVDILINQEGRVECARLKRGHRLLRDASLEAARKWTFKPYTLSGEALSVYGHLELHFSN